MTLRETGATLAGALMAIPLLLATPAHATIYLDQINDNPPPLNVFSPLPGTSLESFGQTFTIGRAGTLNNIRVPVFNFNAAPFAVTFYLAPVVNFPVQQVLLGNAHRREFDFNSADFPTLTPLQKLSDVNGWFNLDLSADNIAVQPGDRFALFFTTDQYNGGVLEGSVAWLDNIGQFENERFLQIVQRTDQPLIGSTFYSLSFATYVSGVPEPDTWIMMLLGFGAAGLMLRSTRARRLAAT